MKIIVIGLVGLILLTLAGGAVAKEPVKNPSAEEQLKTLWEIQPGFGVIMMQVGERFKNLYFAPRQGNWDFARHQAKEIEGAIKIGMITRPQRAESAKGFLIDTYPMIFNAIDSKNLEKFEEAFEEMMGNCMMCHFWEGKPFVTLKKPVTAASPVLGLGGGSSSSGAPAPGQTKAAAAAPMLALEKDMDLLRSRFKREDFKAIGALAQDISQLSANLADYYPQHREKKDFNLRIQRMKADAARLAKAAEKKDKDEVEAVIALLTASCQLCHAKYKK